MWGVVPTYIMMARFSLLGEKKTSPFLKRTFWSPFLSFQVLWVYLECGPLTVTVTTRIITFLVGDPYKPSLPLLLRGGHIQGISSFGGNNGNFPFDYWNISQWMLKTLDLETDDYIIILYKSKILPIGSMGLVYLPT